MVMVFSICTVRRREDPSQQELLECREEREEQRERTLSKSVCNGNMINDQTIVNVKIINLYNLPTSGVSMLLTAPSEPAVIEELVEDIVVLEPYHLRAPTILT